MVLRLCFSFYMVVSIFSYRAYSVHKCNAEVNMETSEVTTPGGETSHDGCWGAKPHSRTRRDYLHFHGGLSGADIGFFHKGATGQNSLA